MRADHKSDYKEKIASFCKLAVNSQNVYLTIL